MDSRLAVLALLALAMVANVQGHVFRLGDCPKVEVQKDFEMEKVRNHFLLLLSTGRCRRNYM